MTAPTIRAMLEGQPAAIDDRAAAPLLAMAMPDGQAAAMEGERFQVQRGVAAPRPRAWARRGRAPARKAACRAAPRARGSGG